MTKKKKKFGHPELGPAMLGVVDLANKKGNAIDKIYEDLLESTGYIIDSRRHSASKAGLIAELLHVANFEQARVEAGRADLRSNLTEPNHVTTDIRIQLNGKVVESVQAKYHKDADRTYAALRHKRYADQTKLVPEEQFDEVRALARKAQTKSCKPKSAARQRTSRNPKPEEFTDHLSADGVHARPVSSAEARAVASGDQSSIVRRREASKLRNTALSAAKVGAAVGGTVSTVHNVRRACKKEISGEQAVKNILVDTVESAAVAAGGVLLAHGIEQGLPKVGAKLVGAWAKSGPLAAANLGIILVRQAVAGQLTWKSVACETMDAGASLAGAELGAAAGTAVCPVVGTALGVLIGGWIGPRVARGVRRLLGRKPKQQVLAGMPAKAFAA